MLEANSGDPLTHFDDAGKSRMVDVTEKTISVRTATASGRITMNAETLRRIVDRGLTKGDVFEVARLAGIMAAKRTGELIPLCHPLPIEAVTVDIVACPPAQIAVSATAKIQAKTGVEMEALTAVSVACLTIYDMCKSIDRGMSIGPIQLEQKTGGRSGTYNRQ